MNHRIKKAAGTSVITFIVLMSLAPITFAASEVKGTLSSDGSSGSAQETGNAGGGTSVEQTLSGTVVGGTEDRSSETMAAVAGFSENRDMLTLVSILIPLILLAGVGFIFFRRRV